MPNTHRKVDYRLRSAKQTERRMILHVLQRIGHIFPIEEYQYIGFGSIYFADFRMIHKHFGLSDMTSIEDASDTRRFDANKPYKFIRMVYERASTALPKLNWAGPAIVWLDYDGPLNSEVIADVRLFVQRAASRSVLIVTVNAVAPRTTHGDVNPGWFADRVGEEIATQFSDAELLPGRFPDTCALTLVREIEVAVAIRNGTNPGEVNFKRLASFVYEDNAKMVTFMGVLLSEVDTVAFGECHLTDLAFVKPDTVYEIRVPNMTPAERHKVDQLIPDVTSANARALGVPLNDLQSYVDVYRYAPLFADVEL